MIPVGRTTPLIWAPALRIARSLWRMLPWLAFGALLLAATWLLDAPEALRHQALVVAAALVGYAVVMSLAYELLSPQKPALRVIPVSDGRAVRLAAIVRVLLFFVLLTEVGAWLVEANGWRASVAALLRMLRNLALVLFAAGVSSGTFGRLGRASSQTYRGVVARVVGRWLFPLAVLTALFLVATHALGYVPLARFVGLNAGLTALKLLVAALAYRYVRRSLTKLVTLGGSAEQSEEANPALIGIERIGAGFLWIVFFFGTVGWILSGWGLGADQALASLGQPIFGTGALTWGVFLGGIAQVLGVLVAGWLLRDILIFFVFPKSRIEVGARYAILAILRYVVITFAALFGLEALGMDTGSLGWFLGAAGIGLAFGLQDIIGNFFSGLIMLLEQPIRVGDMIQVGDAAGTVEDIRMRGTSIRTFDNTRILIPNRQMLGERVTNLSYRLGNARVQVDVGIAYHEDPKQAAQILLDVARNHPDVLKDPAPNVRFLTFGASSLDLSLLCFTEQVRGRVQIASELRFEILNRFREAGIEIPFPQQDVHIRSGLGTSGGDD